MYHPKWKASQSQILIGELSLYLWLLLSGKTNGHNLNGAFSMLCTVLNISQWGNVNWKIRAPPLIWIIGAELVLISFNIPFFLLFLLCLLICMSVFPISSLFTGILSRTLSHIECIQDLVAKASTFRPWGGLGNILQLIFGCLTSQQHASVSQGWICSDNFTCCHTEIEVADQTFYLTQSLYTDTGPTSPSADLIMPGAWQGSLWSANF